MREERPAGALSIPWDLKDDSGAFVQPGTYRWKAISHPGLDLRYVTTPYPNITANTGENAPWLTGQSTAKANKA